MKLKLFYCSGGIIFLLLIGMIISQLVYAQPIQPFSTSFLLLFDTPTTYTDKAGEYLRVKAGENGLEFSSTAIGEDSIGATELKDTDAPADEDIYTYESTGSTGEWHTIQQMLDIPFTSNGLLERTGAATYGIATEGTDYYKPGGVDVVDGDVADDITIDLATLATTVTVSDDEATDDNQEVVFTTDNTNLESDGDFHYNPNTGMVTAEEFAGGGAALTDVGISAATSLTLTVRAAENVYKGQAVYISGSTGAAYPNVSLADADDAAKIRVIGVAAEDIANTSTGLVRISGLLTSVDTFGEEYINPDDEDWDAGQLLYLHTTPGNLTKTPPTTGRIVRVANSLYGDSNTDAFVVHAHVSPINITAAPTEDIKIRIGDNAGANKVTIVDNDDAEVAKIDSDGSITAVEFVGGGAGLTAMDGENITDNTIDDDSIDWSDCNLADFDYQTNWRVFYSDGSGDVTELAFGTDGQYLKSNGATSAPTWAAPAGAGDMLKSTYDVAEDGYVDANDTAYAASWDGNINAPSMNAVYDKIQTGISTPWDDIGDPDAAATVDFKTYTQTIDIGITDAVGGSGLVLNVTGLGVGDEDVVALEITTPANGDIDFYPIQIRDDSGGDNDLKFYISSSGTIWFAEGAAINNSIDNKITFQENNDFLTMYFSGTNIDLLWTDGALNLRNQEDGVDAIVNIIGKDTGEKGILRVRSDGADKHIELHHDDTDGHIITDTGDIHIEPAGGDVSLAASNLDTTGNVNFGGADLELPQGQTPDTDGDVDLDFTDGTMVVRHGSAHAELGASTNVVMGKLIDSFSATIYAPDQINDVMTVKAINSIEFPHGVVITAIYLGVSENSNYTLTVQNFDDFDTINAGNGTIDTVTYTADTTGEIIDTTPTYATIAAGQIIMVSIPSTDVDWIHFEIYYYEPTS